MRVLVDTNVFLELFLNRENHKSVSNFFRLALTAHNQTFVSAMSIRDIGYVMHRVTHDAFKSKQFQIKTYSMVSKVANTTADSAIDALYSDVPDFEDSMQSRIAEEAMCDAIITYNKKDFEKSNLPVFTPEEMNEIWSKENR